MRYNKKKKNYNLNVEGTKNNKVFIVVQYKDIIGDKKLSFFIEIGNIVDSENNFDKAKGYVLLVSFTVLAMVMYIHPILKQNIWLINSQKVSIFYSEVLWNTCYVIDVNIYNFLALWKNNSKKATSNNLENIHVSENKVYDLMRKKLEKKVS